MNENWLRELEAAIRGAEYGLVLDDNDAEKVARCADEIEQLQERLRWRLTDKELPRAGNVVLGFNPYRVNTKTGLCYWIDRDDFGAGEFWSFNGASGGNDDHILANKPVWWLPIPPDPSVTTKDRVAIVGKPSAAALAALHKARGGDEGDSLPEKSND